jgi:hypothetical protein
MGFVEGETGSCIETCVTCDVDGTEEASINVEEAIVVKDEIPEVLIFPPIKAEQEVALWVLCERWWQLMIVGLYLPQKRNSEVTFYHFVLCVIFSVPYIPFEIWIVILKRGDFLGGIAMNRRIILKCILK